MLANGLAEIAGKYEIPVCGNRVGSLSSLFFTDGKVENYIDAKKSDTERYAKFFHSMLAQGVYFAPAQFEAAFISYAHTKEDIKFVLTCAENAMKGSLE
jgi:glutamate-1-semialdehyde 2,1-aminomutase